MGTHTKSTYSIPKPQRIAICNVLTPNRPRNVRKVQRSRLTKGLSSELRQLFIASRYPKGSSLFILETLVASGSLGDGISAC